MAKAREKEKKANEKTRIPYGFLGRLILAAVATSGILSLALVAPGIGQGLVYWQRLSGKNLRRYRSPAVLRNAVKHLQKKKLIFMRRVNGSLVLELTEKGKRELLKYQLQEKRFITKTWDKKWRLIIFDIPERRKSTRDLIRRDLAQFGLVRLQDSVWIYPHDCEEVITLLKVEYSVGKDLLFATVSDLENDAWLKKKFSLMS